MCIRDRRSIWAAKCALPSPRRAANCAFCNFRSLQGGLPDFSQQFLRGCGEPPLRRRSSAFRRTFFCFGRSADKFCRLPRGFRGLLFWGAFVRLRDEPDPSETPPVSSRGGRAAACRTAPDDAFGFAVRMRFGGGGRRVRFYWTRTIFSDLSKGGRSAGVKSE